MQLTELEPLRLAYKLRHPSLAGNTHEVLACKRLFKLTDWEISRWYIRETGISDLTACCKIAWVTLLESADTPWIGMLWQNDDTTPFRIILLFGRLSSLFFICCTSRLLPTPARYDWINRTDKLIRMRNWMKDNLWVSDRLYGYFPINVRATMFHWITKSK